MRVFTWEKPGYRDTTLTPDDSIRYYKSFFRAAFMAIEPGTGHIKAYVGGPNYRYFKYDNVRQGARQVGSTIKPFLYTLAMESGMTPCDPVLNAPVVIVVNADGETWSPQDTHADGTMVDLTWGLAHSSNSVSAYLMKQLGAPSMVSMMRKMGITGFVDPVASLCVGSADLSVYDMVTAYNTFPSGGMYTYPIFVTRIEDSDGNVLGQFSDRKREALSQRATGAMIQMMRGVVDGGTGARLRFRYGLKGEIAGKTGTTNDNSDGWFIGYTPSITAGVWVGAEDRYVHFSSTNLGQGANMALPIWGLWMQKVLKDGTLGISRRRYVPGGAQGFLLQYRRRKEGCDAGKNRFGNLLFRIMAKYQSIAVIYGSDSSEWEVSCRSGEFTASRIDEFRYDVYEIFARFGKWKLVAMRKANSMRQPFPEGAQPEVDKSDFSVMVLGEKIKFDFAYIMQHGAPGETGLLQGYFEMLGIPHSTCSAFVTTVAFDKYSCKSYLRGQGLVKLAPDAFIRKGDDMEAFSAARFGRSWACPFL